MTSDLIKQNFQLREENKKLKNELKKVSNSLSQANNRIKQLEGKIEKMQRDEDARIEAIVNKAVNKVVQELNEKHKKEVNQLQAKINRLESRLNINSSNSSVPTSKQSMGKNIIQNNREKSDRKKGGQLNHKPHKLEYFKEEEITETVHYTLEKCPKCGGDLVKTNTVISDVIDVTVKITKTRNKIQNYRCSYCRKNITANDKLPRGVVYGTNINSMALSLMNEANTPLNKIVSFFSGITNNEVNISEGYLAKLQKKSAQVLEKFYQDLNNQIITLPRIFWDDTVCKFGLENPAEGLDEYDADILENVDKKTQKNKNGIVRFYGDDNWALLIGHKDKTKAGIEKDGILAVLPETCVVMHDHLLLNYNPDFKFINAECNEHTKRYLKRNTEIFPNHEWASKMRDLLINTYKQRNKIVSENASQPLEKLCFTKEELNSISDEYDKIINIAYNENESVDLVRVQDKIDELSLIKRLDKFKENHLLYAYDFTVAFTNNTSERGLRQVKRKLAVSFNFKNINRMKDYAIILSYLETCYRNEIPRYQALKRLFEGNPYTVEEIKNLITKKSEKN